jgi:hypothetical protein
MSESAVTDLGDWQYGLDPGAEGLRVASLGRAQLPLGDAVRLELADPGSDRDVVHVQYVIDTDAGSWALWIACPRAECARHEALLREILPVSSGDPQDRPPSLHPRSAPFASWDEG